LAAKMCSIPVVERPLLASLGASPVTVRAASIGLGASIVALRPHRYPERASVSSRLAAT
jgi:hypothetical protein